MTSSVSNILKTILEHSMYISARMQIECSLTIVRTFRMRFKYSLESTSNAVRLWLDCHSNTTSYHRCISNAFQSVRGVFGGCSVDIRKCYATWIVPRKWSECLNTVRMFLEYSDRSSNAVGMFWTCEKHPGRSEEWTRISGRLSKCGQKFWSVIRIVL